MEPLKEPRYVRPAPVRRSIVVRVVVTAFTVAVVVDLVLWLRANPGPTAAFGVVLGVPLVIGMLGLLHWAWKRHPF